MARAAEEAVTIRRPLAGARPDAFRRAHARSLKTNPSAWPAWDEWKRPSPWPRKP